MISFIFKQIFEMIRVYLDIGKGKGLIKKKNCFKDKKNIVLSIKKITNF
jgi:hypothetical protein